MKLVSTKELTNILGVSRQAIYKWRKLGMPVEIQNKDGKLIRYDWDKVKKWLNKTGKDEKRV